VITAQALPPTALTTLHSSPDGLSGEIAALIHRMDRMNSNLYAIQNNTSAVVQQLRREIDHLKGEARPSTDAEALANRIEYASEALMFHNIPFRCSSAQFESRDDEPELAQANMAVSVMAPLTRCYRDQFVTGARVPRLLDQQLCDGYRVFAPAYRNDSPQTGITLRCGNISLFLQPQRGRGANKGRALADSCATQITVYENHAEYLEVLVDLNYAIPVETASSSKVSAKGMANCNFNNEPIQVCRCLGTPWETIVPVEILVMKGQGSTVLFGGAETDLLDATVHPHASVVTYKPFWISEGDSNTRHSMPVTLRQNLHPGKDSEMPSPIKL
jgi:hypothetical protein